MFFKHLLYLMLDLYAVSQTHILSLNLNRKSIFIIYALIRRLPPQPWLNCRISSPTDLDWSGHIGSIQSHFAEQATKHPERTCVFQNKKSESPEMRFTYFQIREASNVLARHLVDAGVKNGMRSAACELHWAGAQRMATIPEVQGPGGH